MKIYDWAAAPNPKRLRMFLVEKGLQIEIVQVVGDGFVFRLAGIHGEQLYQHHLI